MNWLKKIFGGGKQKNASSQELTQEQLAELTKDYLDVFKDEGASGRPFDYESTLQYLPPSRQFPGKWPNMPLCGCCSVLFLIDPRKCGLWVASGAKGGGQSEKVVPIYAVCLTYLNQEHHASSKDDRFPIPSSYDQFGQEVSAMFPLDDLQRVAVMRIALLRKKMGH